MPLFSLFSRLDPLTTRAEDWTESVSAQNEKQGDCEAHKA